MSSSSVSRDLAPEITYRTTKEGRRLTYQLTVIQQPERARACGSGAKSSADRRPVDPPPVVELRIFEGVGLEKKDITFSYDASFFLYATLELARPIAHGRMPPAAPQVPVLTGMPVSGMAYLDRPIEAGYFIFPDLSVRHEGRYKLNFTLYEETKEIKDQDAEPANDDGTKSASTHAPNGSFDWRLEVKSIPFVVYSAKKFPGLAESTMLSRTVAEQGCRVRIRRDVRMRRRDGKPSDDNYDQEEEFSRSRRTASPAESTHDVYTRPRSLSHTSVDRQSYTQDRRPSMDQYPQQYQPAYGPPPPMTPQSVAAPQFPPPSYYPPQHSGYSSGPIPSQAPQHRFAPPPPPPPQAPISNYYQPDHGRSVSHHADQYAYEHGRAQQEAQMRERHSYERAERQAQDEYHRRASIGYPAPPPPPPPQGPQYSHYPRGQSIAYPASHHPPRDQTPAAQQPLSLAPLKMPAIDPKYEGISSPSGPMSAGPRGPAGPLPSSSQFQERPSAYSNYGSMPSSAASDGSRVGKRPFDTVFGHSSSAYSQPLHNGMRPNDGHQPHAATPSFDDDDDAVDIEALKMQYKRADGNIFSRELPTLQ